jgi:hypothetical protein
MKIGFIVECSQMGPDEVLMNEVMGCFRPKDKHIVLPKLNKGNLLHNAVTDAAKLIKQGCDKVFVLWDWHPLEAGWGEAKKRWRTGDCRTEAAKLRHDLHHAGLTKDQVVLVCVTQEVEAWALADKAAIKARVEKRLKTHQPRHITIPKTPKPEEEPNPERRLENIFARNDVEMVKHQDVPEIFRHSAGNCFKEWDVCPAFVRFVDRLLGLHGGFARAVSDCQRRKAAAQVQLQSKRGRRR